APQAPEIVLPYAEITGTYLCDISERKHWWDYVNPGPFGPIDREEWRYEEDVLFHVTLGDPKKDEIKIFSNSLFYKDTLSLLLSQIEFMSGGAAEFKFRFSKNGDYTFVHWSPSKPDSIFPREDRYTGTGAHKVFYDIYWKGERVP
ncbi:MAG: hypothetical protein AAFQ68_26985, partial [Bacteroidota bacterium]